MNSAAGSAAKDRRPHPIDVYVGNRLRLVRKMHNVSQEKLAEILGITFQQVQKYENGTNRISASRLHQAAHALDVPVSFFFPEPVAEGSQRDTQGAAGVMGFLSSAEGMELNRAFAQIEDPRMRRGVLELIRSIAVTTR
jgi:transcriptional regulator with XRE-family HTH domain